MRSGVGGSDERGCWLPLVERARDVAGAGFSGALWLIDRSLLSGMSFLLSKFLGDRPLVGLV